MVTLPPDPYTVLGVDRKATAAEIRTAYRKLVLKCHPDKVDDPALKLIKHDEFQKVQEAYELLGEQDKRDRYDEKVRLQELRSAFASTSMQPNSSVPRTPPKYHYATTQQNTRTAEQQQQQQQQQPPRAQTFPSASASASKMYSHSMPKSWDESRAAAEDVGKTARRTASYDERSSAGKREDERRRRRDFDEEEEEMEMEMEREREREREREKERRQMDREQRRVEKAEREEKRAKKEKKEKDKEERRSKRADSDEKKSRPRYVDEVVDEEVLYETDRKKSSSRSLDKDAEKSDKSDKEKKEKKRERERERERERNHDMPRERERERNHDVPRERSVSAQREDDSIENKQQRNLEQAMKYIKTSQAKAAAAAAAAQAQAAAAAAAAGTPTLGRANTYTAGVAYVPPPSAPMPPLEEEEEGAETRRPARVRRGSQESRTKEKLSSKKMPSLDALVDEEPFIVDAAPPSARHNLSRSHTTTTTTTNTTTTAAPAAAPQSTSDREFARPSAEIPIPLRRSETFNSYTSDRDGGGSSTTADGRGRHRSRHQAQVVQTSDDDDDDGDDFRPKNISRRGSRARSPDYMARTTVYTVDGGRSHREASFRSSPERSFAKPQYSYVQAPAMASARTIDPRGARDGYPPKVRVAKSYTEQDISFAQYRDGTWGSVPA